MKNLLTTFTLLLSQLAWGQEKTFLFVGTYTDGKPDKGIYIFEFNEQSGELKKVATGKHITNPSYLTLSPNGEFIYACTDTKLPQSGSISAFKFNPQSHSLSHSLSFLNKQYSGGENPVYVTTSKNNEYVITGNYSSGTVAALPINPDGSLQPIKQLVQLEGKSTNPRRQEKSHIHSTVFSPDFNYLFAPDLGADKIFAFQFNPNDSLPLHALDNYTYTALPGSGPRHFAWHPNGHFGYCIEELSGTVTAFHYDEGKLDTIQRIFAYSKLQEEYNSADIHLSSDGKFLYASNRFDHENTIAIFAVDEQTGKLTLIGHQSTYGDHPRNFTIDPSGNFLLVANQVTNNIVVFRRNPQTGLLTRIGKDIHVPNPSCLQMKRYGN